MSAIMTKRFTQVLQFAMGISLAEQAAAQVAPAANKPSTEAKAPSAPAAESPAPATEGSGTTTEPLPETPSTASAIHEEGGAPKDAVKTTSEAETKEAPAKEAPATPATPPEQSGAAAKDVDVDLESDESGSESRPDNSLQFYGFADFSTIWLLHPEDSIQANFIDPRRSFQVGRFNLYMSKQIAPSWNFLAEVRYMYLPNGAPDPSKPAGRVYTIVPDYTSLDRPSTYGSIGIERIQLDYEFKPWLNVRVGQWLTPYGIWNVDHGSPTLIQTRTPYMIGDELFPTRQTGLLAFGKVFLGDLGFGYYLGLSNGRGPLDSYRDLDMNKAVTARVELGGSSFGTWKVGASYYRGSYTDRTVNSIDIVNAKTVSTPLSQYDEQSVGVDASLDVANFVFRGEFVAHERVFTGARPPSVSGIGLQPDDTNWGAYGIFGYELPWFGIMPNVLVQYYHVPVNSLYTFTHQLATINSGIRLRPTPVTVFKINWTHAMFPGAQTLLKNQVLNAVEAQISWVF
jgi:hypothetical protein